MKIRLELYLFNVFSFLFSIFHGILLARWDVGVEDALHFV